MRPDPATAGPTGVTRSPEELGFAVETADRISDVDAAGWDAAVEALRLPVFYSRAFLAAYERHPLTSVDACRYLLIRRGGTPTAVLPAYLQLRSDPLGQLAAVYPEAAGQPAVLSHVWHCYDTHCSGDPAVAAAAVSALRRTARDLDVPWCGLVNLRRDGPAAAALAALGLPVRRLVDGSGRLVDRFGTDLTGCADLDRFLRRSATPRARRNLERYHRRAAEHGVTSAVEPVDAVDTAAVAALCRGSAGRHGNHEYYPPGRFEPFLTALGPAARVVQIRQRGRLVAVGVCLLDPGRLHLWAGGADYRVDGNFSPYYLMIAESLALALRLGRPDFEGGRGNPDFKLRHGLTARPLAACLLRA